MLLSHRILEQLHTELAHSEVDYAEFLRLIDQYRQEATAPEKPIFDSLKRLVRVLQNGIDAETVGTSDVTALLRQVMRLTGKRLPISAELWNLLQHRLDSATIVAKPSDGASIMLQALAWQPRWLPTLNLHHNFDDITLAQQVAGNDLDIVGDGMVNTLENHNYYRTRGQKLALHTALFAPEGSTLLGMLPTGSGKSLCFTLPAWLDVNTQSEARGTTIVIVPTIALAHDHNRRTRLMFPNDKRASFAWTSHLDDGSRQEIRDGLANGSLPLLYISPEALLSSNFRKLCIDHARYIKRLVIDEAHLVETWGRRFRMDFQLLSTFWHQLYDATQGKLRTALFSATITAATHQVLRRLFTRDDKLVVVQDNRLRPEIDYYLSYTGHTEVHEKRVLEAIHHLPRPMIVYTVTQEDANQWHERLWQEGYRRLRLYTGSTDTDARQLLLDEWQRDEIDIMVATTAFGVGVDKANVRSVIHAALPDNPDRFYQEVGRSGRDGFRSISLLIAELPKQEQTITNMTKTDVISPGRAWIRWNAMRLHSTTDEAGFRHVSTHIQPADLTGKDDESRTHNEWNLHILLLMQQAGIIRIVDFMPQASENQPLPTISELTLEVRDTDAFNYEDPFKREFGSVSEPKRNEIKTSISRMKGIVTQYADEVEPQQCLSYELRKLYPNTQRACGGCANCRRERRSLTPQDLHIETTGTFPTSQRYLDGELQKKLGARGEYRLMWRGGNVLPDVHELVARLVRAGIQQIIAPDDWLQNTEHYATLLRHLTKQASTIPHRVIPATWLLQQQTEFDVLPLPTLLLYTADDAITDKIYQAWQAWRTKHADVAVIHLHRDDCYLASEHGLFRDRVGLDSAEWEITLQQLKKQQDKRLTL